MLCPGGLGWGARIRRPMETAKGLLPVSLAGGATGGAVGGVWREGGRPTITPKLVWKDEAAHRTSQHLRSLKEAPSYLVSPRSTLRSRARLNFLFR
jgi:hypothetical protein